MVQAGKPIYFIGNWKSNKTLKEAEDFISGLSLPELTEDIHVVICPPFPYLWNLNSTKVELGAQDISPFPFGAYTGAVTAAMISSVCKYVIVGHSERRKYFKETNQDVAQKARIVLDEGMVPVLCIDEPYLESQLAFFNSDELSKMIVAYEPLAAIGSGVADTPAHASQIANKIKQMAIADVPVLYGGSVTQSSASDYIHQDELAGVLVGGASLNLKTWIALIKASIQ